MRALAAAPLLFLASCSGGTGPGDMAYSSAVLSDAPVAYWRFEEPSGPIAIDSSGYNRPGFFLNGPVLGASVGASGTGDAISLENESDGVYVEYASWMRLPTFSAEAWVRPSQIITPEGMIVVDKGSSWNLFIDPQGRPAFQFPGDIPPEALAPTPVAVGQTYHLVGTFDGGTMRLYVNGELVGAGSVSSVPALDTTTPVHIGRGLGSVRWEYWGVVDEVAIYAGALSAEAILEHYQAAR